MDENELYDKIREELEQYLLGCFPEDEYERGFDDAIKIAINVINEVRQSQESASFNNC